MLILEILSGQVPFAQVHNNLAVMQKILTGEHPVRPQGVEGLLFTDDLWRMLLKCWSAKPGDRPTVEVILECLKDSWLSATWRALPSSMDNLDAVLLKLGVELRLIHLIISTTQGKERSSNTSPSLTLTEAGNIVEILDSVCPCLSVCISLTIPLVTRSRPQKQ